MHEYAIKCINHKSTNNQPKTLINEAISAIMITVRHYDHVMKESFNNNSDY